MRATTIDLKKLISFNWRPAGAGKPSDELVVSGIAGGKGLYIHAYSKPRDIPADTGLPGSFGNGSAQAKAAVALPVRASRGWALSADQADDAHVLEFTLSKGRGVADTALARFDEGAGNRLPLATPACVSKAAHQASFLRAVPTEVDASCSSTAMVEYDAQASACWVRLNRAGRFAVVPRS